MIISDNLGGLNVIRSALKNNRKAWESVWDGTMRDDSEREVTVGEEGHTDSMRRKAGSLL